MLDSNQQTIQKADLKARKKMIWIISFIAIIGFLTILILDHFHKEMIFWLEKNIDFLIQNSFIIFLILLIFISPILALSIYLFILGIRSVNSKKFPPSGYTVLRDTKVLKDSQGIQRGRIIQIISILLFVSASTITILMWLLLKSIITPK